MEEITKKRDVYMGLKPQSMVSAYKKAYAGSKAAAVKAKCLDCTGDQRLEVKNCDSVTCPLWSVRPFQTREMDEDEVSDGDV